MFKLVIEDDEGNKTVVPVIRDEITIGRQEGNTIRLTERNVSRRHARLVREDDKVYLEEISARYGTKKNGEKISSRTDFGMGDVFSIGDYRLTLQSEAGDAKAPPPAAAKPNGAAAPAGVGAPPPKPANPFADAPTQVTRRDEILGAKGGGTEILPAAPAKLVIVSSNFAGQEFPLKKKEMVIGRGEECDIIVDHRSVSTQHAKVVREQGGEYKMVDLNSKNGVKVSGEEYRNVHLKRGDVVELGHVKFRFVEPGENYVFTPQSVEEFAPAGGSNKGLVFGLIGLAVVAVAVLAAIFLMDSGGNDDPKDGDTSGAVATTAKTEPETTEPDPVDDTPEPESNKADEAIAKAKTAFEKGRMQKAIETLNTVREFLDPTPEQVEEIESLLSKARMEKTPARDLEVGRDHLANDRFADALETFQKIPPDTAPTVYGILESEGLVAKAVDGMLAEAQQAAKDGDKGKAEELANAVLAYDEQNEGASAVIAELKKASKPSGGGGRKRPPRDTFKPDPELGQQLFQDATKSMLKGQWNDAIQKCRLGLRHGETRCNRVLGISYKNVGDEKSACKHLKRIGLDGHDGLVCD
jgi:pSer/pThr/pTyr-binding forkhead associated (FHA) protein